VPVGRGGLVTKYQRQSVQSALSAFDSLHEIQKAVKLTGILFESEFRFVKKQLADFFEISERTIESYVEKYEKEIAKNGYEVIKGKRLADFKLVVQHLHVPEMDFVNTPVPSVASR
jgi:hypothetical protein